MRKHLRPGRNLGASVWLFLESLTVVLAARVGLWLVALPRLRVLLRRLARAMPYGHSRPQVASVVRAVTRASALVPRATCLTQALAAEALLGRYGWHAEVRIGVRLADGSGLIAHAWVEREGKPILGGATAPLHFTALEAPSPLEQR
jgi:hypothetical protein